MNAERDRRSREVFILGIQEPTVSPLTAVPEPIRALFTANGQTTRKITNRLTHVVGEEPISERDRAIVADWITWDLTVTEINRLEIDESQKQQLIIQASQALLEQIGKHEKISFADQHPPSLTRWNFGLLRNAALRLAGELTESNNEQSELTLETF